MIIQKILLLSLLFWHSVIAQFHHKWVINVICCLVVFVSPCWCCQGIDKSMGICWYFICVFAHLSFQLLYRYRPKQWSAELWWSFFSWLVVLVTLIWFLCSQYEASLNYIIHNIVLQENSFQSFVLDWMSVVNLSSEELWS